MKKYWIISAIILLLDQLTKIWAQAELINGFIDVWPGVARFRYARNTGAAFSMFHGNNEVLAAVTCVMILIVLAIYFKEKDLGNTARGGLILITAGGAGNLIDRFARGYVVDFIEPLFIDFAIFNVADAMVCVGAALVVLGVLIRGKAKDEMDS